MKYALCSVSLMFLGVAFFGAPAASAAEAPSIDKNVVVYYEAGRYGGWPANYGIWSWDNEILVGFNHGYYKDQGPMKHAIDQDKPRRDMFARSTDGGETWTIEEPVVEDPEESVTPIDFTHPDFAQRVLYFGNKGKATEIHVSYNRGKTWLRAVELPSFGTPGIQARTDYQVESKHECTFFLTAAKSNGKEGRPLCVRTSDGGATWDFLSWIGPEPKGFAIMPSSVRLSDSELLVAVRRREGRKRWQSSYLSLDNGASWEYLNDPVADLGEGNPSTLIKLQDGRLCLTYGFRAAPFRIAAKLSEDNGRTWGEEIVLRDDGANRDQGYTRTVQRPDGKIVTVYYFNEVERGPERYIAATIWDPGSVDGK
jgi:photosystem II stability/assembly factor-like uncharacterized protein